MISSKYNIDLSDFYSDDGGYCTLFRLLNKPLLGFKEFISKSRARYARRIQIKLSKLNLAPKVYSRVCKMGYEGFFPGKKSGWGYVTELAKTGSEIKLSKIQKLVDSIYAKTKLKFWDCHWANIGYVIRDRKKQLVCIDTGRESFDGHANYWQNIDPGPKCSYCLKYKCKC
jgi:hypothetical protein